MKTCRTCTANCNGTGKEGNAPQCTFHTEQGSNIQPPWMDVNERLPRVPKWIPVSEKLPDVEDLHEKSLEECKSYLVQRRCGIMDVAHYIKIYGESHFSSHGRELTDVIAWMPLPEPYNPNTCKNKECLFYCEKQDCIAKEGCDGYTEEPLDPNWKRHFMNRFTKRE